MFDSEAESEEKVNMEEVKNEEDDGTYPDMTCSVCYESMANIAQESKKQQNKEE